MNDGFRSLRVALLAIGTANIAFGVLFLFNPKTVVDVYDGKLIDGLHLYLSSGFGALLIILSFGAFLAFTAPIRHMGIVIMLISAQFLLFITDVIILAREEMEIMTLFPEMLYFLVTGLLLVRYFPTPDKGNGIKDIGDNKRNENRKLKIENSKDEVKREEKIDGPLFEETTS
ncbi:MAG: hypothetical protein KAS32_22100 [Candidatus Peribacteraceae bacterium]|nr:hypothetical protein [Candidatus Peribacteraceae bacterium]